MHGPLRTFTSTQGRDIVDLFGSMVVCPAQGGFGMKKMAIFIIFLSLVSCNFSAEKQVKISNYSSYDVSFQLKGYNAGAHTLAAGKSDTFKSEMSLLSFTASPPRVSFRENSEFEWEFYNNPEIVLKVNNKSSEDVELSALGCIENEPLILPATGLIEDIIYTSQPEFTASVDKFPVHTTFRFDELENTIYLTIR
jgi:hypothetical protein